MRTIDQASKRIQWSKPEIVRIEAGSAETTLKSGRPDGGTSPATGATNFS